MRIYPEIPARRWRAIAADAAVVVLLALFAWLGTTVHDAVDELSALGRGIEGAGASVERSFGAAADAVGGAPVVGGSLSDALRDAGSGSGGAVRDAGREGEQRTHELANLLGWLTFLIPAGFVLYGYLPDRIGTIRRLTAADRALRPALVAGRHAVLAQRAAFALPYATLLRHTRDPFGDLEEARHDALVAALLDDAGLRAPPRGD